MLTIKGKMGPEYRINDPGNGVIGQALRTGEPYEAKLLYHIFQRGFRGTCIDVGAHVGNHTLWFALACGLKVCSFEPIEYRRLSDNLQLNNLNGAVRTWPVAAGEHPGHARVVDKIEIVSDPEGDIPVVPIDDLRLEGISFIKIDVEGWEPEVIRGAHATIERSHPVIYAEARDKEAHARNALELDKLGYKHTVTMGATPMEEWEPC